MEELLVRNDRVHNWETAVRYHFVHVLIMCLLASREPFQRGPWISFLLGIVIFSGTLYLLAVSNIKWLGAITPIGGLAFLVGWGWLVLSGLKQATNTERLPKT